MTHYLDRLLLRARIQTKSEIAVAASWMTPSPSMATCSVCKSVVFEGVAKSLLKKNTFLRHAKHLGRDVLAHDASIAILDDYGAGRTLQEYQANER